MRPGHLRAFAPLFAISLVAALATTVLASQWRTAAARPEVIILGSGNSLSVVVRAGDSRLLLASGDDIDDFDRAYGSVLRPTIGRLDILVVAGVGQQMLVPERLVHRQVGRSILALRPIGAGQSTGELARAGVQLISKPTRIRLNADVSVTFDPHPDPDTPEDWTATVTHQGSRILVAPMARRADPGSEPVSAVIVTGEATASAISAFNTRAIIARGRDSRDVLGVTVEAEPASTAARVWTVHDSEALRMELGEGHIRVERANVRQLNVPTVVATTAAAN